MTLADNLHVLFAMPELLAFVLLWQRRTAQMRRVAQTQSVVVAILAALKAWLTHTPSSVALALVCTVAGGLALLSVLRGQHAADLPPSPRALIASSILVVLLLLALHLAKKLIHLLAFGNVQRRTLQLRHRSPSRLPHRHHRPRGDAPPRR